MVFVVDASVVAAWLIDDEATPRTEALLDLYVSEGARSPDLLAHEMRSIAVKAVRRKRLDEEDAARLMRRFGAMSLGGVASSDGESVLHLALRHGLTAYDAAYLAAAKGERLALATLDHSLRAAAAAEGVAVLPDGL